MLNKISYMALNSLIKPTYLNSLSLFSQFTSILKEKLIFSDFSGLLICFNFVYPSFPVLPTMSFNYQPKVIPVGIIRCFMYALVLYSFQISFLCLNRTGSKAFFYPQYHYPHYHCLVLDSTTNILKQ